MKNLHIRILSALLLLAFLGFLAPSLTGAGMGLVAMAKSSPLKVFVNEKPSSITPVEVDGARYMPLYFPVEPGAHAWEVTVSCDPAGKVVKIGKARKGETLRGDHKCDRCSGSGDCQACYPTGSGKNVNSEACPVCNGNGDCTMCNGNGSY